MTTQSVVKDYLLNALVAFVDQPMSEEGFSRNRSSFTYTRTIKEAEQQIVFAADWFPKYQPGAEAHIHPMIRLAMPEVSKRAIDLVRGDEMLLAGAPEIILNQPIEFAAPKDAHLRWFPTGPEQFNEACQSILAFHRLWVFPLLKELSTPEDLVRAYETNDGRLMKQKHWHIFVAAAYQILGRLDDAFSIIQKQFGSPGLRKRYSKLFEAISEMRS
jgi:hypothetical protein